MQWKIARRFALFLLSSVPSLPRSVDPLTSEIRVDLAATTATGLDGGASSLVTMRKNCMKYLMRTIAMVPIKLSSYAVKLLGAEPA